MNTLINKYDSLEEVIYNRGLSIHTIDFHQDLFDAYCIKYKGHTSSKYIILPIIRKKLIGTAQNYKLIGNGKGVHWPDIDEDLSLKGFLRDEFLSQYNPRSFRQSNYFLNDTDHLNETMVNETNEVDYLAKESKEQKIIAAFEKFRSSLDAILQRTLKQGRESGSNL